MALRIERYKNTRHWALYDGAELVVVTVYKRGAQAVQPRLAAQPKRQRAAAYGFSKLPAFLVAHISGRRPKQARHTVLFPVLRHVDAHECLFIIKQESSQRLGQLGFANAGCAQKNERTNWPLGIFESGARAPDGICQRTDGGILANDVFLQPFFHLEQAFRFSWLVAFPSRSQRAMSMPLIV